MKYSLSPRKILRYFPRAQVIFHSISRLESQYRHSHVANPGLALVVEYTEVTAVSGNVDIVVAVELIASLEAVLAAMLTCSQSNIHSHGHKFNHQSLHPSFQHPSIDSSIHPSIHSFKIAYFFLQSYFGPLLKQNCKSVFFLTYFFCNFCCCNTSYYYRTPEIIC